MRLELACRQGFHPRIAIAALLLFVCAVAAALPARAGVEPGPGFGWLTISSHKQASDAISIAQRHSNRFPATTVFQTDNGYFNVTLGWTGIDQGKQALPALIAGYGLPGDSYFTGGGRFTSAVWTATGESSSLQALVATTRLQLEQYGFAQSGEAGGQTGVVSGLNSSGDNFLSLRSGPGSRHNEITRMHTGDRLTIHGRSGNWLQVSMGNGTSGWAYGKYVTVLAAAQPNRNVAVETVSPRNGFVTGLNPSGDNYLSLRSGPGGNHRELARMTSGTAMTITGRNGRWLQVSLSNGMQGWAHSKYVRVEEVPVIGPDNSQTASRDTGDDVPVIGPDDDGGRIAQQGDEPAETEQQASLPGAEPEPVTRTEPVGSLSDQKRVALVMGNSAYLHTTALPNPKNDADAITAKLKNLGFEVVSGLDGGKPEMELAIREFVKILPGSDVALFFYAGHAMQVDGRNHLIPVDARLEDKTALDFETIDLGVILGFMSGGDRISVALLDACRDNPLSRRFARSFTGATRSAFLGRGLAAPETAGGEMLIGFATAPGEVALDGDGNNSPFTTALLKHIDAKGLDIELMLKRVRNDVYEMTAQSQEPWVNSALRREFQFNPD